MDSQRRWISFDTFKLIVVLLLLILILFLALRKPAVLPPAGATQATPVGAVVATQTLLSPTITVALPTSTAQAQASTTPTAVPATATIQATATTPPQPSPTATTIPPTATPTTPAQPEPTATSQTTPTATPQSPTTAADCPLAQPSRLAVGNQALVTTNLNLRQDAGMDKSIIQVWLPNTNVEIVGGPVCTPYQNGAYLWWNIKSPDGKTGWSAEASLSSNVYFLQPVP